MKTIWKYQLPHFVNLKSIPIGSEILTAQVQNGVIVLWALVDTNEIDSQRLFHVIGTGWKFPKIDCCMQLRYIATVQRDTEAAHIFEESLE